MAGNWQNRDVRAWDGTQWVARVPRIWDGVQWTATQALSQDTSASGRAFPQLAGMLIGNPHNYDETPYQQQIARLDLAILGMYNTWSIGGKTPAQAVGEIKAYNPNILLGNYTIMTDAPKVSDDANADVYAKLNAEHGPNGVGDWWAYDAAGQHVNADPTYDVWGVNVTLQTTPDDNGDRWPQWMAKRDNALVISNAAWDIWYSDNNFWRPRLSDVDWNRDGTNDDADDVAVQDLWRDGQRAYYDTALSLQPGKILMANTDNDLDGVVTPALPQPFTQYKDVLGGAFLEHVIGQPWSIETWGGWQLVMNSYHRVISNLTDPKACIFDAYMGDDPADYQTFRYAFASALMDNGYFSASSDYNEILWYDEYDLAGSGTTGWLGEAVDVPQTAAWQNGVYRRQFAGGMVLVNPKGNGQQTVTVGSGYHRFSGTQDATTNNGQPVTSTVTLADRDAVFLVKD